MILFFDSSALAKRYVDEPGTGVVLDLIRRAERVVASRFTWVEITSAVSRAARDGAITQAEQIIKALDRDFAQMIDVLEVTAKVLADARLLCNRQALRAGDAVQLGTAMAARNLHGNGARFICSDRKLLDAAQAEGFEILDPTA